MTLSLAEINRVLDIVYPPSGNLGYLTLLSGDLISNLGFTVDTGSDELTTGIAHGSLTGARFRVNASVTLPAVTGTALSLSTDYFIRVVDTTTLTLHRTLDDALTNSNIIDFVDSGSGTLTLNEQILNAEDDISVLVSKELTHLDYNRFLISSIGSASGGVKIAVYNQVVGGSNPTMEFRHVFIILDGTSTIGDDTGVKHHLFTSDSVITINPGQSDTIGVQLQFINEVT